MTGGLTEVPQPLRLRAMDTLDPRALRDAFGSFATGVTVVTGRDAGGTPVGLTANSFTSLSLDPPLLLFCPSNTASALPGLQATKRFVINVLDLEQEAVANRFASKGVDRFADAEWHDWDGLPVLAGAKAVFACDLHADHDGGDHRIIIGRVHRMAVDRDREPLLYLHGRYARIHTGG